METAVELGFLVFGLGFFIYVLHHVNHDNNVQHQQRIAEMREFGIPEPKRRRFRKQN